MHDYIYATSIYSNHHHLHSYEDWLATNMQLLEGAQELDFFELSQGKSVAHEVPQPAPSIAAAAATRSIEPPASAASNPSLSAASSTSPLPPPTRPSLRRRVIVSDDDNDDDDDAPITASVTRPPAHTSTSLVPVDASGGTSVAAQPQLHVRCTVQGKQRRAAGTSRSVQ